MHGIIATWRMALEGIEKADAMLKQGKHASDAIITAIREVEDYPYYKSVGYGGLPNQDGVLQMDAGYMDGNTMDIGAVCAIEDFASPVSIAQKLSHGTVNNILVGEGAAQFGKEYGFEQKTMLTDRAKRIYEKKKAELAKNEQLRPYDGHDTVCFVCKDENDLISACSTSGLFMKEDGRLGDTPIVGCGYYADSKIGAASATGVGEEISRGMISYETVRLMGEGYSAMDACQKALAKLNAKMDRELLSISVIALDANGNYGVATNCDFAFSYASENCEPKAYFVNSKNEIRELNENDIID